MLQNIVLPLVLLTALYAAGILGAIWLLRWAGVPIRPAIMLGFLGFGVATACLAAWLWPVDSSVYPNAWAVLFGDWVYQRTGGFLGDPWLLRVPVVYIVAAILLYGGLGLLAQGIYGHGRSKWAGREARGRSTNEPF